MYARIANSANLYAALASAHCAQQMHDSLLWLACHIDAELRDKHRNLPGTILVPPANWPYRPAGRFRLTRRRLKLITPPWRRKFRSCRLVSDLRSPRRYDPSSPNWNPFPSWTTPFLWRNSPPVTKTSHRSSTAGRRGSRWLGRCQR